MNRINIGKAHLDWRQGSGLSVEIYDIEVPAPDRRCGIGRKMVDELIDHRMPPGTLKLWAITRADNRMAQLFYEELRFRSIPLFDFYGNDGMVDAILYIRDIGSVA